MDVTPAHRACFELGIKCGAMYHQFAGAPVSPESAASLERAMAESIENQPYCEQASVTIDRTALSDAVDPTYGYAELTGSLFTCRVVVRVEDVAATAELTMVEGYPELRIVSIES